MKKVLIKLLKNQYLWLAAILIGGLLVRLYKINNPIADWHSWRQADTASVTRTYVEKGIDLLYPRYHDVSSTQTGFFNPKGYRFVEFPIYNAINAVLAKNLAFLSLEIWGRLLSIFSSIVSAYLLYLIGKRFLGSWGGILSAFFFAFLPFNIYFSRVILPEPMAVVFGLAAVWFFVRFIDSGKSWFLYFSGLAFSVSLLIKPFTIFYATPLIYLLLRKYGKKVVTDSKLFIKLLVFVDIVFVPFFAWRAWMGLHPAGIPFYKWVFNGDRIRFRPAFWRWIFGERLTGLILGFWGLIPFSFGLLDTKRKKSLFTHFFFLGIVLYMTVVATANVRHDYYQTLIIPAISLMLAQGTLYMWKSRKFNKKTIRPLLIFSLLIMLIVGVSRVKEFYKINHPEIIKAGQAVDKITPKDALVIAPYYGDTAFLYQTKRWGWPFMDRVVETLIDRGADYFVSVNLDDTRTQDLEGRFKTIEKTGEYVILNLHEPI